MLNGSAAENAGVSGSAAENDWAARPLNKLPDHNARVTARPLNMADGSAAE